MPGIAVSAGHHSPGADRSRQGRDPTYGGPEAQGHGAGRQTMAIGRTNQWADGWGSVAYSLRESNLWDVLCCVAALGMEWIDWAAGVCL